MISDDDVRHNVAVNLQSLLDDRDWSQSELARRSGVWQTNISRVIREECIPTVAVLARLAEALHVSMDRLVAAPPEKIARKKIAQPA